MSLSGDKGLSGAADRPRRRQPPSSRTSSSVKPNAAMSIIMRRFYDLPGSASGGPDSRRVRRDALLHGGRVTELDSVGSRGRLRPPTDAAGGARVAAPAWRRVDRRRHLVAHPRGIGWDSRYDMQATLEARSVQPVVVARRGVRVGARHLRVLWGLSPAVRRCDPPRRNGSRQHSSSPTKRRPTPIRGSPI